MGEGYSFIDIFAGAGGLAEGFIESGFFPIAHVEMNKQACNTLETRLAYHYLRSKNNIDLYNLYLKKRISRSDFFAQLPNDITSSIINEKISDETIDNIFSKIKNLVKSSKKKVDVIVGGPPCQAYSLVGRSSKRINPLENDEKNYLYIMYARFLEEFRPKIFVFENVLGILSAKKGAYYNEFIKLAKKKGYKVNALILNSEDYGVLQNRKRVVVVGCLDETLVDEIVPEKVDSSEFCVEDLLKDLPSLSKKDSSDIYLSEPTNYLRKFLLRNDEDVLTWHVRRPNNQNDKKIYKTAIMLWNNNHERLKYSNLPTELKTHKNESAFLDRYKVVAPDRHSCQTMLAHISKDGHYFIHPDVRQCRSISVREAARIQSFPDSYYFEGSRCAAFTQIGNAVPPLMAKQIALKIKQILEKMHNDSK